MKLDFATNVSHDRSASEEFCNDFSLENTVAESSPLLRAGVEAALQGNRAEARLMLLQVTVIEPGNEDAWMYLASVSEYPEELLGFLGRVLEINPHNEQAQKWAKSTKNLLSKNFVERGMSACKDAHKDFARQCFLQAIAQDGENDTAWLWLATVSDSAEEKTAHLEKVLSLNPENENATVLLKAIKNQKVDALLQKAVAASIAGEAAAAREMLEEVLSHAPDLVEALVLKSFMVETFDEKINCFERILDIDDENELANVNWTALLDIMSKAELATQNGDSEKLFASIRDGFEESGTALDSTMTDVNFGDDVVSPSEDLEAVSPKFDQLTNEKEISENNKAPENFRLSDGDESAFAESEPETSNKETEVFGAAAQNYTDYSQPQTKFLSDVSEDYSQYASSEISTAHDTLPSDDESEKDVSASLSTAENVYQQEFEKSEEDVFVTGDLETEDSSVFGQEEAGEESPEEMVYDEETLFVENFDKSPNELLDCPFCNAEGEAKSFVCNSCRTVLTLSDLERLLAHQDADREILRQAVERMEAEGNRRDFSAEDLKLLAVGQLNLKNLRQGCDYLEEAAQMNPNDVFLHSQVNFLKIRLAEIEDQQSIHESMPKNRKILVVDDSATVRKLISGKLEKSGHKVFCAVDGVDALEQIKQFVPDLILLDINMPRMDGYQVCKLIRSDELTKDVPIVMISGKDGFFDKVRGRMAGTTGYITKPFGPETLMKMLETYIV